jgi:heme/copper-type cytochrome/quinol oxidase subunit 2
MSQKNLTTIVVLLLLFLAFTVPVFGRAKLDDGSKGFGGSMATGGPAHCLAGHRVGKMVLSVNNNGTFGDGFAVMGSDYFTGQWVPSCEYPKGSNSYYLFAASFWIGAVVGRDTLVSVGADGWQHTREMFPDDAAFAVIEKRSIIDPSKSEFENAISEEDYIFTYADTLTEGVAGDYFGGRPHQPLNIQVTERSFAWSYSYAEDFVLFDYQIKNIGYRTLENVYMGIYVDADVNGANDGTGFTDDICGFLETILDTVTDDCVYENTVNIAWISDNDGDLDQAGTAEGAPVPHVTATRIVRTPATSLDVSFNWWVSNGNPNLDFGPRERPFKGRWKEPWRDLRTGGMGTPEGDINKYYFLRNKEFDYGQCSTSTISSNDTLWMPPNQDLAGTISDGFDTRYLLSFGPFNIDEGQTLPISFAYLAGENFHTDQSNYDNNIDDNYYPDAFYKGLNFKDLGENAVWASWIYDNPGVDTDGDGNFGKYRICVLESVVLDSICDTVIQDEDTIIDCEYTVIDTTIADTIWYEGDGVPDFRGASPPPAPDLWIDPSVGSLRIRFNGQRSETTRDVFSRSLDFEGYRIYLARDARAASYSVVTSYDLEDYNKFVYDPSRGEWELNDEPFTLQELRCLYGDSCNDPFFNPLIYTPSSPYTHSGSWGDSVFYFAAQDFNQAELGLPGSIRKLYPDQPFPSHPDPDSARPEELTEDSCFKYFEYEYVIDNLLPTVPYWVNVTAFDFGSPSSGLPSLESSVTVGAKSAYPLSSADEVAQKDLKVFVYPNPYRIDAGYQALGFEGRNPEMTLPPDRMRLIHFANLPPKCTIRIFTLDGDLVREIVHDIVPSDPNASHDTWNLITRNTQLVVSGLYYWTVETKDGETQIGKLVIIM